MGYLSNWFHSFFVLWVCRIYSSLAYRPEVKGAGFVASLKPKASFDNFDKYSKHKSFEMHHLDILELVFVSGNFEGVLGLGEVTNSTP